MNRNRIVALGLATTVGAAIAGATVSTVVAGANSDRPAGVESIERNAQGQTYGSALGLASGAEPDLIAAFGDDGTTQGYVRSIDLAETPPKSPAEAAARKVPVRSVPLFAADGKTVLGRFTIGK